MAGQNNSLLEVCGLSRFFGGVRAVSDVSFQVRQGEIIGLIGPNGAGKTTLFNLITGMDRPDQGEVRFNEKRIDALEPYQISRLGIARTFQNIRLFKELTVLENVMLGCHYRSGPGGDRFPFRFAQILEMFCRRRELETELLEESLQWIDFFGLVQFQENLACSLPYGKQRELEIARALACRPILLFLDEPAAGMNPSETAELMKNILRIRGLGLTVILIEHDMNLVMQVCERIVVLHHGQKIAMESPQEVRNNPDVIEAYLGGELRKAEEK